MATKLILHIQDPEGNSSMVIKVREDFDEVMNKLIPLQGTSSALEARLQCMYTTVEGQRVYLPPPKVEVAVEVLDGE